MDSRYWQRPEVSHAGCHFRAMAGMTANPGTCLFSSSKPCKHLPNVLASPGCHRCHPVAGYREHILHVACDARPQVARHGVEDVARHRHTCALGWRLQWGAGRVAGVGSSELARERCLYSPATSTAHHLQRSISESACVAAIQLPPCQPISHLPLKVPLCLPSPPECRSCRCSRTTCRSPGSSPRRSSTFTSYSRRTTRSRCATGCSTQRPTRCACACSTARRRQQRQPTPQAASDSSSRAASWRRIDLYQGARPPPIHSVCVARHLFSQVCIPPIGATILCPQLY